MSHNWMQKEYTVTGNDLLYIAAMAGEKGAGMPIAQFLSTFRRDKIGVHRACTQIIDSLVEQGYSLEEAIEQCPPDLELPDYGGPVIEITRSLLKFVAVCDAQHIAQKWAWDSMGKEERKREFDNTMDYGWLGIVGEKNVEKK